MTKNSRISFVIAVALLLVGVALRLHDIATLPPGLHSQEIIDIRLAENVRRGDVQVFYEIAGEGREGLYPTMLAAVTALTGRGTIGYHIFSAWLGLIALAVVYALGRRLYGDLAGLAALSLLAVSMWPVLLSRMAGREALLPLLTAAVLLALALGLPVYWRRRDIRTQTTAFGALGAFVGLCLYIHPAGLLVALVAVAIVIYMLARTRISRQTRSYIVYTVLLLLIVSVPYLTSALRLPELNGAVRLFRGGLASEQPALVRVVNGLAGIGLSGDRDATYNLPGRPMFDPLSFGLMLVGVGIALRYVHKARYAVLLIALALLLPLALFSPVTPYFPAYAAVLPVLALLFGLGATLLTRNRRERRLVYALLVLLTLFNTAWTARDLFTIWPQQPATQTAYQARIAALARHIDLTATQIPTVVCTDDFTRSGPSPVLSPARLMALMINRGDARLRYVDCNIGLVWPDGGERQQVVVTDPTLNNTIDPLVQQWFALSQPLPSVPVADGALWQMNVAAPLADTVGRFTTTAPVAYAPEAAPGQMVGFAPPVRFGNNLTFLGYETLPTVFNPGDTMSVVTYWRVDGPLPADLQLFTHVQDDPSAAPLGNRSGDISIVPWQLAPRDVFMQVTHVPLPASLPPRRYLVSIGAYRERSPNQERLTVFDSDNQPRGDRLILYMIDVVAETTRTEGQ